MSPALIRAAATAYHVSPKLVAAALDVIPSVPLAWAVGQGFPDTEDPNSDANRAHLVARALLHAPPGWWTTQIAVTAAALGHTPLTRHVWRARWWRARGW